MNDPAILFVKPQAISADDKQALQAVGVVVIEIDDPNAVKFTRAAAEVSTSEMLGAACSAIKQSEAATKAFAKAVIGILETQSRR